MNMDVIIVWDMMPTSGRNFTVRWGGSRLLWNFRTFLPDYST